ncbi:PAS domain S-box protein [Natronorubrum sp. JWXQ-INN-674]|uniref:histidine kinase n=1 Tax=Natronorubrum halalkaliphilum TaxID=2691917 RepID=A0A6B0VUP2_9EURY|nr:PAS domain-containing sensor histidine kinase [Natronorubrum halalkaliphilum]MXV64452.1 PAS domain S-box protein [Natronorubrum halalkaliphilum]
MESGSNRKRRDDEFRELSQFRDAIIQSANVWINALDETGTVTLWNEAAEEISGYTAEEVVGSDEIWTWLYPDETYRNDILNNVSAILQGEKAVEEFQTTIETKDGSCRTLSWNSHAITDAAGELQGSVAVGRDITDRTNREREFEALKERFQAYVETASDLLSVIDEEGISKYESPAVKRMLGYEPDELVGEDNFQYIHPDDRAKVRKNISTMIEEPDSTATSVEYRYEHADGHWVWLETVGCNKTHTAVDGYVLSTRDITERKEREQELRRQNDRLSEFSSIVSHDLRNPVNIAQGYLEAARAECDSDHLEDVEIALTRIDQIVNQTLSLARHGETIGKKNTVDTASLAEQCWKGVDTAGADLRLRDPPVIKADPRAVRHLFENLFRNAIEHGGEDVTVCVGPCDEGFYVEDDGVGLPDEVRTDLFAPLPSAGGEPAGLGLTIVKRIIDAHEWEIQPTESAAGGARFEIRSVTIDHRNGRR